MTPDMAHITKIREVRAREVLDSRGFPTVEVEIRAEEAKGKGELKKHQ